MLATSHYNAAVAIAIYNNDVDLVIIINPAN